MRWRVRRWTGVTESIKRESKSLVIKMSVYFHTALEAWWFAIHISDQHNYIISSHLLCLKPPQLISLAYISVNLSEIWRYLHNNRAKCLRVLWDNTGKMDTWGLRSQSEGRLNKRLRLWAGDSSRMEVNGAMQRFYQREEKWPWPTKVFHLLFGIKSLISSGFQWCVWESPQALSLHNNLSYMYSKWWKGGTYNGLKMYINKSYIPALWQLHRTRRFYETA